MMRPFYLLTQISKIIHWWQSIVMW